jgi:AcrR family transcriptional regulator
MELRTPTTSSHRAGADEFPAALRTPRRGRTIAPDAIVEVAMRHFAERGYQGTRTESVATELGIAKGSVFAHFGSKQALFFACYRRAVSALPAYLDAPTEVVAAGFFATIRYWLDRTEHLVREDWMPYRVALLGNHASELELRRDINRWLAEEDPYGTAEFVRRGIAAGDVRADVSLDMVVALVDWLMERFQDALVTEELDPGLFGRTRAGDRAARIDEFMIVLRGAIGAERAPR